MVKQIYIPETAEEFKKILLELIKENSLFPTTTEKKKKSNTGAYTIKEAAEYLRISLPTLSKYTKDGTIRSTRLGNRVLYSKENLDDVLNKPKCLQQKKDKL